MTFGNLNFLEPSGPLQSCNGTALPFCFTCSEYIINIKRSIIYLLGDSHHTSNRWKNYLYQVSTFYGIKEG